MKKTLLIAFAATFLIAAAYSQNQFDGIRSSNYLGVKGVYFNPANIADNPYKWDANLFALNAGVGDYNVSFNLGNFRTKMGNQTDSVLFGTNAKAGSAFAGIDVLGPSFMISINKKTTIAFTTRARVMVNVHDIDGKLVSAIQAENSGGLPYTLTSTANQSIALNGWTDYGVSVGRVLVEEGHNFLKGGITLKYLAGISNMYTHLDRISGTVNNDAGGNYLTNASGIVQLGEGGVDLTHLNGGSIFQFKGSGVGADLGAVYEYRRNMPKEKYRLKISFAILDLGSIRYHANPDATGGYVVNIPANQKFYLNQLKDSSLASVKNSLNQSQYFQSLGSGNGSYGVSLPTTVVTSVDMNVLYKFYVNLDTRFSLHSSSKFANPYYQNNFTLTPRFETRGFGAYMPLNINSLTGFNAGLAFREGPFFIGSGSLLTSLLGNSKQADIYIGIHVGVLRKS
ncbi:MAG TPA: DUF5723 family protein [Puia sp.]|nr:DUF5723 family protein [Puia sp.]